MLNSSKKIEVVNRINLIEEKKAASPPYRGRMKTKSAFPNI